VGHPQRSTVYVYSTDMSRKFGTVQVIDNTGLFGTSIAVYGDNLMAIGAPEDEAVHIFEYSSNLWKSKGIITDYEGPDGAKFGNSVAMDDKVLVVGAEGIAEIFGESDW
jgi:hypothetical protein